MSITPAEPTTETSELGTRTSDLRIRALDPLPAPNSLLESMPLGTARSDLVTTSRREVRDVLTGDDDRLLAGTKLLLDAHVSTVRWQRAGAGA